MSNKFIIFLGFLITGIYLLIHLIIINNYGVTWDFTYHFNAGLQHLGLATTEPNFVIGPSPPLSDILPTLSYQLFYEKLNLLPFDSAYNLYSVIIGSLGVGILYFFVSDLFGWKIAMLSSIILALNPRYFGHLHNNMKDIPQAVFFTLSVWLFWRLYNKPCLKKLFYALLAFAIAYNSKVNAVFILPIALIYTLLNIVINKRKRLGSKKRQFLITISYIITAPLTALLLWWPFWTDPLGRLIEASHSYTTSTTNMPILYFGNIVHSGSNVPWHYPFGILLATTPLIVAVSFIVGFVIVLYKILKKDNGSLLLILWFFIPIARYFKPHMIVIDDIRHFLEIIFPLAVFSAVGAYNIYLFVQKWTVQLSNNIGKNIIRVGLPFIALLYLVFPNFSYHPYQTNYFSELVGGIKGAEGKFDIDFWASSYKQAISWLNDNAPKDSIVIVAMVPDIAKLYLRSDLRTKLNQTNMTSVDSGIYLTSDFSVILNRQSFYSWYGINPYILNRQPIYTLKVHNVPLVSIYQN